MDLVYSTHFMATVKQRIAEADKRDGTEIWVVLAALFAGAAMSVLLIDPASVNTLMRLAEVAP
jgi:hypothetical protein